ncbi:DUF3326 domain-containing protein [Almyronema epifaneia]|uniref:DUF3326 domain-containing protein n=1 Tax=Almyronema epifaneia S1 TaxID=2991925 RepID=A0ABW6IHL7_9CYAN
MTHRPYTAVLIVPTGIGASIGGYAGDALPVARLFSQAVDRLITHPNVLNGAQLYWPLPNAYYVEGYGLDCFAAGLWGLRPVHQNRIGLVLDAAIESDLRWRHLQAANATKATLGLTLTDYVVTDEPLNVELRTAASGATWGTLASPDSLLRAVEKLRDEAKAEAIAVVARFPDDLDNPALQQYRQGQGVDPLAGAEAVISHLVVKTFEIPCAHAPALAPLPLEPTISPKSAAEEIGYTFLPCVLAGLSQAPQFVTQANQLTDIWADQVDAVVIPAGAAGGSGVMSLSQRGVKVIAVEQNQTALQVSPTALGISAYSVSSYLEAVGVILADRAGIDPHSVSPQITAIQALDAGSTHSRFGHKLLPI